MLCVVCLLLAVLGVVSYFMQDINTDSNKLHYMSADKKEAELLKEFIDVMDKHLAETNNHLKAIQQLGWWGIALPLWLMIVYLTWFAVRTGML
jgi:hypothetical protein